MGYYINSNTDPQNLAEDKSQIHTFMFGGLVLLGLSCALFLGDVTTSLEIFIEGEKKNLLSDNESQGLIDLIIYLALTDTVYRKQGYLIGVLASKIKLKINRRVSFN